MSPGSRAAAPLLALGLLAAAVNNLPASLIGVLVLHQAQMVNHSAIYAIILAVDIGSKLTPFGSLATLLWLSALERDGIHIGWGHCFRENWWVAVLTLAAAFGGLLLASLALG